MARVGLREVSRHAGVSVSTVSHILSGRASRYAAETQETVIETAKKLGYQTNSLARSLRRRKTFSIGLAVPEFFFRLDSIEHKAAERGYRVQMAAHHGDPRQHQAVIDDLVSRQVDGLLLIYPQVQSDSATALLRNTPVVAVDVESCSFHCSYVNEIKQAAYIATRHLIALGHCDILYVGPAAKTTYGEHRIQGYVRALNEHGLAHTSKQILELPDAAYPSVASETVMDGVVAGWSGHNHPTAVVASNCEVAAGAIASLTRAGIQVPGDVSVISTMDQIWAKYNVVPITAVDDRYRRVIEDAMDGLLDLIDGTLNRDSIPSYVPRLMERASCSPA